MIFYNLMRISLNKLRFGKRFAVHWMQRFSPSCDLKLFDHAQLFIGRNTEFAAGCDFEVHGDGVLHIGENTYFNRYCMISAHQEVRVGSHCMFGPGVRIFDNNHCFSCDRGVSSRLKTDRITIGDHCWIAANVIILKGTHIGDCCVIGAGCIVSGDIPSGTLVRCRHELTYTTIDNRDKEAFVTGD